MTSKRTQLKKTPIYIFFLKKQIPQNFKKIPLEDFTSYSVSKDDDKVLLNLEKISKTKNFNFTRSQCRSFWIGMEYYSIKDSYWVRRTSRKRLSNGVSSPFGFFTRD